MTTILRAPTPLQTLDRPTAGGRLADVLRSWWAAYRAWRAERLAVSHLSAMSDRQLKDIGLVRSQIEFAVKVDFERDRAGSRIF